MKLEFSGHALDDLKRLRAFIAKDNKAAAQRINKELRKTIKHLARHPEMGMNHEEKPNMYSLIAAENYDVRYCFDGAKVSILRIWHVKEDRSPRPLGALV